MASSKYSTVKLEDGAIMAYEIRGSSHLGVQLPIVLIAGMSSRRCDWERLATSLADDRPVLIFDHRGMGDSTLSPTKDELINIESLARDLLVLLEHLQWKELAICGFSMGGVVAQQLLFLPYHGTNPTLLPFRVTHVLLAATLCSVLRDKRYGLRIDLATPARPRTEEEKKAVARPTLESLFDPQWVANPANKERFEALLNTQTSGRPMKVILQQGRALNRFDFTGLHDKLARDMQILVIHGEIDGVVPLFCGEEILRRIPWAKTVEIGTAPGQVPSHGFGHNWFEYFDIRVWRDAIRKFLGKAPAINARL
ncbi:Haloacetate dehalogenase H-1 [Hypsizygus marmoreus]|uniref:Haloacetate dehalogenase H-1 n=1 Tax=Hypsizygus marmoreus TaxID=39966 RepID=A0A369JKL6_HYPMA|nr:Haloacetate dehalogenase H-1 [Hypsizygus marmoreus]